MSNVDYISVQEAAKKWGISERRIPGMLRFSRLWLIPKDAKRPIDRRYKTNLSTPNIVKE